MHPGQNDNRLNGRGVDPSHYFLYQRWNELLDSRTLDMYQYDILNPCLAVVELADVIDKTLTGLLTSRQNVDDVKAEALEKVKLDEVLEIYNKPLRSTLLRVISQKIEKQSDAPGNERSSQYYTSLKRMQYQLIAPVKCFKAKYLGYLCSAICEDIATQNVEQLEKHLSSVVSQCIYDGWSTEGLLSMADMLLGTDNACDKLSRFLSHITDTGNRKFKVFCNIKIETKKDAGIETVRNIINSLGMTVAKGTEIIAESLEGHHELYTKLNAEGYYFSIDIDSKDCFAAALSIINTMNRNLSVAAFYNVISPYIANVTQIVVFSYGDNTASALSIFHLFRTYDYVDSRNSVFEDTRKILMNKQKSNIMARLHAAFSYTNLSRTSLFQESKYLTLWVAVEAFMRTGQYSDIISHIKQVLPEILAVRYVYRMIRNFSEDCIRCKLKRVELLGIDMEDMDKRGLVKKIISAFRTEDQYQVLEQLCQCNSLLLYRCRQIHAFLNDISNIKNRLEHFVTKVKWHIQRLYRIRNEITHSAFQSDNSLTIYIEHLYTYLSQLISEVVFYVEHKNSDSVEEAYATITDAYRTYMELLNAGHFTSGDAVIGGIIEF